MQVSDFKIHVAQFVSYWPKTLLSIQSFPVLSWLIFEMIRFFFLGGQGICFGESKNKLMEETQHFRG